MQKWEYRRLVIDDGFSNDEMESLQAVGLQGWDIVTIIEASSCWYVILKRAYPKGT